MFVSLRKIVMAAVDAVLVAAALYISFMVRFDWNLDPALFAIFKYFSLWAVAVSICIFYLCGLYQWSFRYASLSEAMNVFKAVSLSSVVLVALAFFMQYQSMGRSVLITDYLFCLLLIGLSRFGPRAFIKLKQARRTNKKRALIIGAGLAGQMVVRELINNNARLYEPVGFVDDDPLKLNVRIHGVRVLGPISWIEELIGENAITDIILAIPSAGGQLVRAIIAKCEKAQVHIKTVPALHRILTGEVTVKQIRDVEPEDLLGRATVTIDLAAIGCFLGGKRVLVTGAGGTIGKELCRQIAKFSPQQLLMYDHNENDTYFLELELKENFPRLKQKIIIGNICDVGLLKRTFSLHRPQIVFHAAAHKHVPLMENDPAAAVKNNIIGTRNLLYAADHYGVESFVMISTDKAVRPTSVMGASKRVAEMVMQAKAKTARTKFMAVRFGNVIGSSGSAVPIFKRQIEKGGPVTVTHPEVRRFFMTASEASQLVMQAAVLGKGGEIFILDMGEQIRIVDLARDLIILSGFKPEEDIEIKFTGLRPGEKLYEEILHNAEEDKTTRHEKIYIAQPDDFNASVLRRQVKELERMAGLMDNEAIVSRIREMVPSYNPQNPVFKGVKPLNHADRD